MIGAAAGVDAASGEGRRPLLRLDRLPAACAEVLVRVLGALSAVVPLRRAASEDEYAGVSLSDVLPPDLAAIASTPMPTAAVSLKAAAEAVIVLCRCVVQRCACDSACV
jgi:hypothetical protein